MGVALAFKSGNPLFKELSKIDINHAKIGYDTVLKI
jgi:hypothetical protein